MRLAAALLVLIAAVATPARGTAQSARVEIQLPQSQELASEPPAVRTIGVLRSGHTAELVRSGFPARLHYKLERWAAGTVVNDVKASVEWEVIAQYDALGQTYRLVRATTQQARVLGDFTTIDAADARLSEPLAVPISLPRSGEKSYYALTLTVEAMSLSDLDEVQRWLKGEVRPAVRGRRNPGTAVSSGLRTLVVRLLGGERIEYETATGVFRP